MKMNAKGRKKMRGFMCQSSAATAVCMSVGDPGRSVIVPRGSRFDRTMVLPSDHHHGNNTTNYARLLQSPNYLASSSSSSSLSLAITTVPSLSPYFGVTDFQDKCGIINQSQQLPKLASSSYSSTSDQVFKEVVMRVSLHCQGCAGKVKKHLSKMEGVTSFSVDLESKRVTVTGNVSPESVLESVSKVKKAEFWPR